MEEKETLRQTAQAYVPPQTGNISSLEKIPLDIEIKKGEAKDKEGKPFVYMYVEHEGNQYRVPGTVLSGIKAIIKKMPHIKYVTVDRQGEGMSTRYHVMPYVDFKEEVVRE